MAAKTLATQTAAKQRPDVEEQEEVISRMNKEAKATVDFGRKETNKH